MCKSIWHSGTLAGNLAFCVSVIASLPNKLHFPCYMSSASLTLFQTCKEIDGSSLGNLRSLTACVSKPLWKYSTSVAWLDNLCLEISMKSWNGVNPGGRWWDLGLHIGWHQLGEVARTRSGISCAWRPNSQQLQPACSVVRDHEHCSEWFGTDKIKFFTQHTITVFFAP